MSHRIQVALERALVRITELLFPFAVGRHRAVPGTRPPRPTRTSRTSTRTPTVPRRRASAPRPRATPPADAPILNDPGPLVRPYLLAHEQHARRAALALALDGIDVGPWVIHGHLVGTPGARRPVSGAPRPVMAGAAA
ncbi:hypothetical protein OHT20_20770 [Streptomyces caniferus]|uniref:hypothetical protein n=1 Tax=Streptomyces caniferus TaxID=285557 RepID=UPI002E2C5027|nr:hypothetical protein [Streptomyces caniferus]